MLFRSPSGFKSSRQSGKSFADAINKIQSGGLKREVTEEGGVVYDAYGNPTQAPASTKTETIPGSITDAEVRKLMSWKDAASTPQTIDALRALRTEIGDSMADPGLFPGVSQRNKAILKKAADEWYDNALAELPSSDAKKAFQAASEQDRKSTRLNSSH